MSILAHRPFLRATVVNFFFFASLNGFVLLPLHVQQLGGTPVEIGVVMGVYSAVGIVSQPLLGPFIDVVGRRPFMLVGVVVVLASSLLAAGAAMAVRVLGGHLIDTLGRRAVIVPSMFAQAVASAGLAALGLSEPRIGGPAALALLVAAGLIAGGAHGFLYPGLAALVTDQAAAVHRGAVVGVFSAVFLFGHAAGAFVFGGVAHAVGYGSMWSLLAALLLAGAGLSLRLSGDTPLRAAVA